MSEVGKAAKETHAVMDAMERALAFRAGALMASYPDEEVRQQLRDTVGVLDDALGVVPAVPAAVGRLIADDVFVDAARSEYIDVFDRSRQRNPLYETEYGSGIGKGNELADISGFYQAFGLSFGDGAHEMPDHLAVELEFYGVLLLKEAALLDRADRDGVEIVEDARRKFLSEHLGRLAPAVAARPDVRASSELADVFSWCRALVETECARLGVVPDPLRLRSDQVPEDEMKCAENTRKLPVVS